MIKDPAEILVLLPMRDVQLKMLMPNLCPTVNGDNGLYGRHVLLAVEISAFKYVLEPATLIIAVRVNLHKISLATDMSVQPHQLENPNGQIGHLGLNVLSAVGMEARHVTDVVKILKEVLHFRVKAKQWNCATAMKYLAILETVWIDLMRSGLVGVFGRFALLHAALASKAEHAHVFHSQALVMVRGNKEWPAIFVNALGDGILGVFGVNVHVSVERVFVRGVGLAQQMPVVQALQQNNHFAMNNHVLNKKH